MAWRIDISPEAAADIDQAVEFISRDSRNRARRWLERLQRTVLSLDRNPERCPLASESSALELPIREILYGKRRGRYRILFTILSESVYIIRDLHGARRLADE